jgi:predicted nucleotidyltransferase component of viral defense system
MRLFEQPDYRELIVATARELGMPEPFVEKDHWITELLRAAQATLPDRVIFKGGTSLSKG